MAPTIGRITEKTSLPSDTPIENWNLEEINIHNILNIKTCSSYIQLIDSFQDKNFFDLFNCSNGFAIRIEDSHDNLSAESLMQLMETNVKKAVLAQLQGSNDQKVTTLIKDSATSTFEILDCERHRALFDLVGDRSLFECEIDEEKFLETFMSSDYLTTRLLCCFEFSNQSEVLGKLGSKLVENGAVKQFKVFVDNCFDDTKDRDGCKIIINEHETDLISFVAASGKPEFLELLVEGVLNLDRWVNLAWEHKNYENVLWLLKHDAPLPRSFTLRQITGAHAKKEINEIIKDRKKLRFAIEVDDLELVQHFVDKYQTAIIGFNDHNVPALSSSLSRAKETDSFEIYAYLLSKGFTTANDSEFLELERKLSSDEKEEITNLMKQKFYGKHNSSHLCTLLSRVRFARDRTRKETEENFVRVKRMFEKLDSIEEIQPILKIFEFVPLVIVFDFKSKSVHKMLLTKQTGVEGESFFITGEIFVGALNDFNVGSREFEVREGIIEGVLIHELLHYGLHVLFNNQSNPYDPQDQVNLQKFDMLTKRCLESCNHHSRIAGVFRYPKELQNLELIVRVPQILAQNYVEGLRKLTEDYPELLEYYNTCVLIRANLFLEDPKKFFEAREIHRLNRQFRICDILEKELWIKETKILDDVGFQNNLTILISNVPHLAVAHLYQTFYKGKNVQEILQTSQYIFTSLRDLDNQINLENVYGYWNENSETILVVDCGYQSSIRENQLIWSLICRGNLHYKTLLIFKAESTNEIEKKMKDFFSIKLNSSHCQNFQTKVVEQNYNLNDLQQSSQDKLLDSHVTFQSFSLKLKKIVKSFKEIRRYLPIDAIINQSPIKIGNEIQRSHGYDNCYVERKIVKKDVEGNEIVVPMDNFKEMMKKLGNQRINVISDVAGQGKTTVFTHMALKFKDENPNSWVLKTAVKSPL